MSCFPCVNTRRKDVRDVDDDMAVRPADSSVSGRGNANGSGSDHGSGAHSLSGKGWESRGQKGNVARSFTFRELATATRNFREVNLIGEGGFGMVFKGRLESGQAMPIIVAIKQLNLNGHQGNQEFIVEVLMLSLLHHPNLVTLIGYCTDGDQRLLVYEFMSMGSLEDHLFVAITAMCLQEHAHFRPLIGDIVVALEYLASQSLKESPRVVARSPSSSSPLQPNNGSFS
ncbi:hypothetical protein RHGRI_015765 [Rhododendron griersonianum]|uniref:Protein kinase domain-containing protein n=1 Tax=Rhododendron griersonianum TaxID=479676 RepID=A0AAV6JNI5_9ERIC|nr:hypothetical protein RHGRI_015765 [Rhododendron griersonianum]KAG5542757.1 hypothetical protein RHGRI_015765 [Rhododendron griersonianum]